MIFLEILLRAAPGRLFRVVLGFKKENIVQRRDCVSLRRREMGNKIFIESTELRKSFKNLCDHCQGYELLSFQFQI